MRSLSKIHFLAQSYVKGAACQFLIKSSWRSRLIFLFGNDFATH